MTTKRKKANACPHDKTRADLQKVVRQVDCAISALRNVLGMPLPNHKIEPNLVTDMRAASCVPVGDSQ